MALPERARNQLYNRLEEVLGHEEASYLMSLLPPVGWADVATKQDLTRLESVVATKEDLAKLEVRVLRTIIVSQTASLLAVAGLAFAAARLI